MHDFHPLSRVIIPWTNHPNHRRREKHPETPRHRKHRTARHHERGAQRQHGLAPDGVGEHGQREAEADVAGEREGHEQADLGLGDAEGLQVLDEDERRGAVGGHAEEALDAEELDVCARVVEVDEAELVEGCVQVSRRHG